MHHIQGVTFQQTTEPWMTESSGTTCLKDQKKKNISNQKLSTQQ